MGPSGDNELSDATAMEIPRDLVPSLRASAIWLLESQRQTNDPGYSGWYSALAGWSASYPETTGYIIPTMIELAGFFGTEFRSSALAAADWLVDIQAEEGWYQGGLIGERVAPAVFNTGQALFGLAAAFRMTGDGRYRGAMESALDWLASVQDADGAWRRGLSIKGSGEFHLYSTRVALAMLEASALLGREREIELGRRNLAFCCRHQNEHGWFDRADVREENNATPLLHFIAYTIEGLLEGGARLGERAFLLAAQKAADRLLALQAADGSLPGRYDCDWRPAVPWICLTGVSQMSLIWLRLHQLSGDPRYWTAAMKANRFVAGTQSMDAEDAGVRGGIAGSSPLNGGYAPGRYLNWAAKFHIDALLREGRPPRETT